MKVVALAGGVGGAKLAYGLAKVLSDVALTVIVNTGDDFEHLGLRICPDLDTVCYTLAGIANPETGWGRAGESWHALETIDQVGGPTWFRLGDYDLGVHLERTRLYSSGKTLSQICQHFCLAWEIRPQVLPMSDHRVATIVHSDEGELPFQDYFVRRRCEPRVFGFSFEGAGEATPAPGVLEGINNADLIVICPSNPWVSIDPILAIRGIKSAIVSRKNNIPVIAVSPIIQGKTIKGPAAKMFSELGINPSASNVANHYGSLQEGGLLSGFVIDDLDVDERPSIDQLGLSSFVTNTIMKTNEDRKKLANDILRFAGLHGEL